ncbi:RNA-directed DNA polymerase, eukaryota, reverse transcriptase zinc-binding domain protein [Tanacetum coccineum]
MPSIVLDDECLISKDLSKALLGRVKEFASLPNLKIVLKNEGFAEIKIQYMGEFWVLLEFPSSKTKELFQENMGVGSWFSVLKQASTDFIPEGRIVWVEIEGVPFKLWSKNTFKRIAAKWGELLDVDDQKEEGFHSKRLCIYSKSGTNIYENFKVIFRGKVFLIRAKEVPGWVPEFVDDSDDDDESDDGFKDGDAKVQDGGSCGDASDMVEVPKTVFEESLEQKETQSEDPFGIYSLFNKNKDKSENMKPSDHIVNEVNSLNRNVEEDLNGHERNSINKGSKEEVSGSVCSGNFKKSEVPRTGGSILCVLEELVKVGQAMGYNMDGPRPKGNKMGQDLVGGITRSTFVMVGSLENSGGILCIWDPNSFRKNNVIVSDYFIMVRGVWLKTGVNIIMVAVYAPQELRDKRILWDYLEHVINQWDDEVVIMGDFNEVRFKSERFGLVFNAQCADVFNAFIASTGLEEDMMIVLIKRLEVLNSIQHLDKIQAMDVTQKAKIKWAIEGDENSSPLQSLQQMAWNGRFQKRRLNEGGGRMCTDKSPRTDGSRLVFIWQFLASIEMTCLRRSLHISYLRRYS